MPRTARLLLFSGVSLLLWASCTGEKPDFPIVPSDNLVRQGEAIYTSTCITCHGDETGSDRQFGAPPHNETGHTWHHPDRLLFEWILEGPPLRTAMPAFKETLSEEEVRAVLAYIKTFWPEDIRRNQITFSQQYEEQIKELGP